MTRDGAQEPVGFGLGPWRTDGEWRHTEAEIGPEGCIGGTDRPLTGVLFALLDVVTGSPPSGAMNPTVDLQVRLFSRPRAGLVRFRARTLRLGRTFYVGEVEVRLGEDPEPIGLAVATFMNRQVPFPERPGGDGTKRGAGDPPAARTGRYRALETTERVGPGVFDLDVDLDTPQGTVPGATLALLVEQAAVDALDGRSTVAVDELELRFLNKVRTGPVRATAVPLGRRGDTTTVRVEVTDRGAADRLVTYGLAVCR